MFPGARVVFDDEMVEREWACQKVAFDLRIVVLACALLYHEHGAPRLRVLKIFDQHPIYRYGRAADVGVLELPDVNKAERGNPYHRVPLWIATRLNLLFPYADGDIDTAKYNGKEITIRVPPRGYQQESAPLSMWREWGASGRELTPRKVRLSV